MVSAVAEAKGLSVKDFDSTAYVSSFETLDIKHYIIGEAQSRSRRYVELLRVPMNVGTLQLALLSDLQVSIAERWLERPAIQSVYQTLCAALDVVEQGHLKFVNSRATSKIGKRVFARIVTALEWYRRSHSGRITDSEAVVSLAVAFETLLTDHYESGVTARLRKRARALLSSRRVAGFIAPADFQLQPHEAAAEEHLPHSPLELDPVSRSYR